MAKQEKEQKEQPNREFVPQYDIASTQRYVDSTSRKTESDRTLDELRSRAGDALARDLVDMAQEYLHGTEEDNARCLEAFLGAFVAGASTQLFDRGFEEAALRQLDQARTILEARQKLSREIEEMRSRAEKETFDVSALLGLSEEGE